MRKNRGPLPPIGLEGKLFAGETERDLETERAASPFDKLRVRPNEVAVNGTVRLPQSPSP